MEKNRLDAFSDGVIAIILTIMVLELKVPRHPTPEALGELWPVYLAYAIAFGSVFMMWINQQHIFSVLDKVDIQLVLANGGLLFFMSLIPFATEFASESAWNEPLPVALYGGVSAAVSLMFVRLRLQVAARVVNDESARHQRREAISSLAVAIGFLAGTGSAYLAPRLALFLYAVLPLLRFVTGKPYRRGD